MITISTQVGELPRNYDMVVVVRMAFVKGSPPFLYRFWNVQNIRGRWAIDLHTYSILTMTAHYTFFMIRRLSRDSVTGL